MQQLQFMVGQNGLLSESAASEQARWYVSKCPGLDEVDFEAHFMLGRVYHTLNTDTPFERKGSISKARYNVLRMLHSDHSHRLLMTDIVVSMNVSPTNITKLVDGLAQDGYVRRVGDPLDKRKVWVELLPAGAEVVDAALPDVAHHVVSRWQGLTHEEKRVLVHLLAKLRLDILTHEAEEQVEGVCAIVEPVPTPS